MPVGGEKGECDARVTRLLGTRDMQARWIRESAASRARLRQTDCTMHRLCVCIPLPISAQGRDMVHAARGGGTERELTLVPIRRLVREQGLAAGVAGEAAILDAKSVELGELLPEHSAHAARGGPNGGECIRASSAQGLEIIALDYATHSSPFPPRAARALRRQHFCCRPGRHAQPDKLRHAAASNKLFRGCFLLHSPALQDISGVCEDARPPQSQLAPASARKQRRGQPRIRHAAGQLPALPARTLAFALHTQPSSPPPLRSH